MYVNSDDVEPLSASTNLLEKAVSSVKSVNLPHKTLIAHGPHMILGLCNYWSCAAFLRLQFPRCGDIYIAV
jgi:hypothetical protein